MPKFSQIKSLFNLFLIRAVIVASFFSFPFSLAKASGQELYSQPFLRQIKINSVHLDNAPTFAKAAADDPLHINQMWVKKIPVVAIIDEGVDFTHPDLTGLESGGFNFINNSNDLSPLGNHGTKVAGLIQAVAHQTGVPIKIMPLIACSQSSCDIPVIAKSIRYAADNGADVINLSFGTKPGDYQKSFDEAIAYAYSKNVIIVAAAGQDGAGAGRGVNLDVKPISPICNDQNQNMVLGVAATDTNNQIAKWTNFGACVDVLAPAQNLYTTFSAKISGADYGYVEGTSFASPQVAALAALMRAQNPKASNKMIVDKIKSAAERNIGVIDVAAALKNQNNQIALTEPAQTPPPKILGAQTHSVAKIFSKKPVKKIQKQIRPRG